MNTIRIKTWLLLGGWSPTQPNVRSNVLWHQWCVRESPKQNNKSVPCQATQSAQVNSTCSFMEPPEKWLQLWTLPLAVIFNMQWASWEKNSAIVQSRITKKELLVQWVTDEVFTLMKNGPGKEVELDFSNAKQRLKKWHASTWSWLLIHFQLPDSDLNKWCLSNQVLNSL